MRYLANRASEQRRAARLLVVGCYAAINFAGIWIGLMLPPDTRIAAWMIFAALLLSAGALISYTSGNLTPRFTTRKWRSLAFCIATLFFVSGNTASQLRQDTGSPVSTISSVHAASLPRHTGTHRNLSIRERFQQAKQWFSAQSAGVKALLIVATVLVTLLLIYFWAAICCGIICDGMEALGYALFFAGAAGAIFGCIRIIQRIVRGPRNRKAA